MEYDKTNLEKLYEKLVIDDEEDGGVIVGSEETQNKKESFILVGRFLTEKNINLQAMRNVLASLWRPKEGVEIHDIGGYRYSFVFYHVMDLRKVVEGGPWSFEQNMLVYHNLQDTEDAHQVLLNNMDIWVQVHDIPRGFISENILKSIGAFIGTYVKSDPVNFDGTWKSFVRIRVTLDVTKPIKRRMKIKREGGNWSWVNFKYERLGSFCFVCGIIGHAERECNIVYAHPEKEVEQAYGVWLRAPGRGGKQNVGARWLRNHEGRGGSMAAGGSGVKQTEENGGQSNMARFTEIAGVVREKSGETGAILVTPQNPETVAKEGDILNLGDNQDKISLVLEAKRKRTELEQIAMDYGPVFMQTDEPKHNDVETLNGSDDPKNLKGAGSGIQTRQATSSSIS
ncbi:hypothetical protein DCAR_0519340 [Daucus carota subsp. sativus]|uniref:CCHC-type domain-containing protein n=1 Tax=Daucus carota subsp. sativus TaxID=79200 RepID=A0AAF0X232_DAUCS|nr:hypothetical protein DCAR_0519340 [Daucus carota subsp. sativus]